MKQELDLKLVQVKDSDEMRALIPAMERFADAFIEAGESCLLEEVVSRRNDIHGWIRYCEAGALGENLPAGYVPATQWVTVSTVDEVSEVVGKISMRHWLLTHDLAEFLGHIGYAVRPDYRRQGIASWQLRAALMAISHKVQSQQIHVEQKMFCPSVKELSSFPFQAVPPTENLAVLLTCNESNVGSYLTIEKCGGVRDRDGVVDNKRLKDFGTVKRRYWLEVPVSSPTDESCASGSTK